MYRRFMFAVACAAAGAMVISSLDVSAAGPGPFRSRSRSSGQATPRVYRSYSVTPGGDMVPQGLAGVDRGAFDEEQYRQPSRAAKPSRSAKPSYMRADSKALGRFGQ